MKYSAKSYKVFLDQLFESHHDVEQIWPMMSDVTIFISKVVEMLGGHFVRETSLGQLMGILSGETGKMKVYEIQGIRFGLIQHKLLLHRTQCYIIVDPAKADQLLNTVWEPEVELEDPRRVFTLKRRAVKGSIQGDLFANSNVPYDQAFRSVCRFIGITDGIARKFQFGWRATQKTKRVAVSKDVLFMQDEIRKLLGYGLDFKSSDEMRKNGTLRFDIPVWAVEKKDGGIEPRIKYAEKDLDYVGKFIIGRKDSVIRWWDYYTGTSFRMSWSPGDHLTTLEHYKGAIKKLTYILGNSENYWKGNRRNRMPVFPNFKFKDGWTVDSLDVKRVDDQISNTIEDMW